MYLGHQPPTPPCALHCEPQAVTTGFPWKTLKGLGFSSRIGFHHIQVQFSRNFSSSHRSQLKAFSFSPILETMTCPGKGVNCAPFSALKKALLPKHGGLTCPFGFGEQALTNEHRRRPGRGWGWSPAAAPPPCRACPAFPWTQRN